mgnify:CR=1 FL=1
MKTIQSKLILLALLLSVSFAAEAKPAKSNKKTVTFNVMMHCHSCQEKIEKNLA